VILVLLTGDPPLEVPGWCDFALPRLQDRYSPLVGSLMIGLLWAVWHLPFYSIPGLADLNSGLSPASLGVYGLSSLAMSIILTWTFNHTRGSLLMAMLVHVSLNAFQGYVNRLFPAVADSLVGPTAGVVILAILIVLLTRGRLGYEVYQRNHESQAFRADTSYTVSEVVTTAGSGGGRFQRP